MRALLTGVAAAAALAVSFQAAAQDYPSKPVRVLVPVSAGTGIDVILRKAGEELAPRLGQPWIVENRVGVNMIPGAEACAKAPPDGYTVCAVSSTSMSFNPNTVSHLPYDAERDFRAVTNLFFLIEGLFVKTELNIHTVKELKALAVAKADAVNFGTLGPGTNPDVYRQWLNEQWSTRMTGIPYKAGNLILQALAGGEIDATKIGAYNGLGLIKSGRIRVISVASSRRLPIFPDVPTDAEAGLGGYTGKGWWGLVAPAKTPDAPVARLNREILGVFRTPAFEEFLLTQGVEEQTGTPQAFAAYMKADREATAALVNRFHIPIQ